MLLNGCRDHGSCTEEETSSDLFERGELDSPLAEKRVDEEIEDWDEDDESERIKVGNDLVW